MPLTDYEQLVSHIEAALPAVHKFAPPTPMLRLPRLDALIGGAVFLKAECLQATGSFKVRGALNVMTPLKQQQSVNHVVAFSSGNHGIGVAYAAKCLQMHASVVVPSDAPIRKVDRIRSLGANIIFYDRHIENREHIAEALCRDTGAMLVKPYDDWRTIAGQGTCGVEAHRQTRGAIDSAIICTGGGGLIAGIGAYLKAQRGDTTLYSAEPEGWDDHRLSFVHRRAVAAPATGSSWCDGLLAMAPGEVTLPINLQHNVTGLCASDLAIANAMRLIWDNFGIALEPSGAVALACLMGSPSSFSGQRVLVTLTGGNVDSATFESALTLAGQTAQPDH
ncbi:MAG: pyridoxal-phosphate dependent enzyme [Halieaceae bacterium]|jgi:threonine dehydratase|nr:pyridoxal-phosphate dependent enzyme [Halieaceae bacterium]MBT5889993.1 pyridoxal-phosphate dependent enzyme [Halieaceae bacterium]